jgi:hypothetical protein
MPKSISFFSNSSSADAGVNCVGMRLTDALDYLEKKKLKLKTVQWTLEDTVSDGKYLQMSGSVLKAEKVGNDGAMLIIQCPHDFNGKNGLGKDDDTRKTNLAALRAVVEGMRIRPVVLGEWFSKTEPARIKFSTLLNTPVEWTTLEDDG